MKKTNIQDKQDNRKWKDEASGKEKEIQNNRERERKREI